MISRKKQLNKAAAPLYVGGIILLIIVAIIIFGGIIYEILPTATPHMPMRLNTVLEFIEVFEFFKLILTTVNAILLIYLVYNYVSIYLEIGSQFSLGLLVLATALLAHTIATSPVTSQLFGFQGSSLGPFNVIPSFFTLIAALVLIHLSRQ